jgi:NDP-sugar pyrophosphorylase family protein
MFKYYDRPIYVLTCDNVTDIDFKQIEKDYYSKKQPHCMIIPTRPVSGLSGDYIFSKNSIVNNLSRKKKSSIYCTGIQVLNPKKINDKIKPTSDFNILWKRLMKIKQLYVSDIEPKRWYTVDNIDNYKNLKKKY